MNRRLAFGLLAIAVFSSAGLSGQEARHFDLLIKGGQVLDGSGNPWFRADVGIERGRIVAVGIMPEATADRVIDALVEQVALP